MNTIANNKIIVVVFLLGLLLFIGLYLSFKSSTSTSPIAEITATPIPTEELKPSIANPASVNCEEKGGELTIKTKPSGGSYGVCIFEDNMQCEEWALMHGECPEGGIKITGFTTDAQIYCVITGGEYTPDKNDPEKGVCKLPNDTNCDSEEYFDDQCDRNKDESEEVTAQAKFNCANKKVIRAVFYEERVNVSLSDGRVLDLNQSTSGSGARYVNSDETIIFWNKGDTAWLDENGETTFAGCLQE